MLKKTPVKKTNKTSVLFEYEGFPQAEKVCLAGEFNDWEPASTPMKKRKDGTWTVAMRLPNEGRFEYRFVVDGRVWIVDESADDMVANPFGGRNSVVVMNGGHGPGTPKRPGASNGAAGRNGEQAEHSSRAAAELSARREVPRSSAARATPTANAATGTVAATSAATRESAPKGKAAHAVKAVKAVKAAKAVGAKGAKTGSAARSAKKKIAGK